MHPVSHRVKDITDFWWNFCCWQGRAPVFNALIPGEPLDVGLQNLASRNWHSVTDTQTDRFTDMMTFLQQMLNLTTLCGRKLILFLIMGLHWFLTAFLFVWQPRRRCRWPNAFKFTHSLTYLLTQYTGSYQRD